VDRPRFDSVFNGADDDGSGSVALLEIAEALARSPDRPKRSILFVWHTAEELGLLGSDYFTRHPTVPRDSIVAQLNMDMIGRGDSADIAGGGPQYLQLVGSRRLSTELGDLVERVNAEGRHGFTFDYSWDANGHPANIYCRSDHYMYARFGIPVTFFTTGEHLDYHQLTDEAEYIDYDKLARVAGLVGDVARHVADLDHRPVVDKPKPDPEGKCKQ
jgi:Zn-dependent M28 family amino/carboxypeptidase